MSTSAQGRCPNAGQLCNCTGACLPLHPAVPIAPVPPSSPITMLPCDRGVKSGLRGLHHFEASEHAVVCRFCGKSPS